MSMDVNIGGRVRATAQGLDLDDTFADVQVTPSGMLEIVSGQLAKSEMARIGRTWWVKNTTAAAANTAMPISTSGMTLFNSVALGSNICFIIDSVYAAEIVVDATQQNETQLWVACSRGYSNNGNSNIAIGSFSGIKTYSGPAVVDIAASLSITDGPWRPVGSTAFLAATVAGGKFKSTEAKFDGEYIIPPRGVFHLAASKLAATASQIYYTIVWHEVLMSLPI